MTRIDHNNLSKYLKALASHPYFQPGSKCGVPAQWFQDAHLLVALGELAEDGLKTMAIVGRAVPVIVDIPKNAKLNAQGLEGACRITKPLFNCLMNLRDLIPQYRGYVEVEGDPLFQVACPSQSPARMSSGIIGLDV